MFHRFLHLAFLAAALAASGCAPAREGGSGRAAREEAVAELMRLERFAARVEAEGLAASWDGREARPFGLAPLLVTTPEELDALAAALPAGEQARLGLLRDRLVRAQLAADPDVTRAVRALAEARRRHGLGDQVPLERALTEEADPTRRREAWMAQAEAARELAPLLREAARARLAWARRAGWPSFLAAIEERRGYDVETARRLREAVARRLAVAPGSPLADPWDVEAADPAPVVGLAARLDAAACLGRALDALALAGLARAPEGMTLSAGADPRGFADFATYAVEPPSDVRVRLAPEAGLFAHWASLHEIGHAAQALLAPRGASPLARRCASDAVSESCAKVFERLAFAPAWLAAQGVEPEDVAALAEWERRSERARMRAILVDTAFEDALYADPDGDLDAVHARLLAEVAGVAAVPGVPAWALHRTVAVEPRGRFDYLLARCAQATVHRRLRALPGGLLGEAARESLRADVLATAPGRRYEEWFERAAGEPASCEAWLDAFAP